MTNKKCLTHEGYELVCKFCGEIFVLMDMNKVPVFSDNDVETILNHISPPQEPYYYHYSNNYKYCKQRISIKDIWKYARLEEK